MVDLPPNTPNLTEQAQTISVQFDSLTVKIPQTFVNATSGFRSQIGSQLKDVKDSLSGAVDVQKFKVR